MLTSKGETTSGIVKKRERVRKVIKWSPQRALCHRGAALALLYASLLYVIVGGSHEWGIVVGDFERRGIIPLGFFTATHRLESGS